MQSFQALPSAAHPWSSEGAPVTPSQAASAPSQSRLVPKADIASEPALPVPARHALSRLVGVSHSSATSPEEETPPILPEPSSSSVLGREETGVLPGWPLQVPPPLVTPVPLSSAH